MTRVAVMACVICALAACGGPPPERDKPVHPRQGPVVTEPGITISGDARIGVVRVF